MKKTAQRMATMLAGVALLASVACSDGEPVAAGVIEGSFLQKANAVCTEALSRRPETPPPLPVEGFDPKHPKPEQLPPIGAHFSQFNDGERVVSELAALGEPTKGAADWRALMVLARKSAEIGTAQIEAANAKDVATFVRLIEDGEGIVDEFRRVGPAAGFGGSSACGKYYAG